MMTPEEADERIILSRHTLAKYVQMSEAGNWPVSDLKLMQDETMMLAGIGVKYPEKAFKLVMLVDRWNVFRASVQAKLN